MGFHSEPGRDDGSLPPVNVVIPDDARDLDRDVLAYRREMRARRRRQRLLRLIRPFNGPGLGGGAAIVPLIAVCLALSLVGGALLSVATISPASAPTLHPTPSARSSGPAQTLTSLPQGTVQLDGHTVSVRSLVSSVIALVPANCGCGTELERVATQASTAHVSLYFVATGAGITQLPSLTARYGDNAAEPAVDTHGVLSGAYHPDGLTVLLVFSDATAVVHRNLLAGFQLGATQGNLMMTGSSQVSGHPSAAQATPD